MLRPLKVLGSNQITIILSQSPSMSILRDLSVVSSLDWREIFSSNFSLDSSKFFQCKVSIPYGGWIRKFG